MTRCACTSRLMSVVGPEVMLNKYNLEFLKMAIPVALQSHCGASREIQVLQPNRSCRERSSAEMRAAPAPAGVVRRERRSHSAPCWGTRTSPGCDWPRHYSRKPPCLQTCLFFHKCCWFALSVVECIFVKLCLF